MTATDAPVIPNRTPDRVGLADSVDPSTAQEVADVLLSAADEGRAVVPVGGGGALALGHPTDALAVGLSTRGLKRILDYQSTDMTLSVEAGVALSEVSAVLAERGQMLPIEAPLPDNATIGGLLATALAGPRRYGGGSLRDVIIGIGVAYPDGTVARAGGLVVKNVSGFDMMRIHYGALGTLGVITSANFKVLPMPRFEFTVLHPLQNLRQADQILPRLRAPSVRPVALVLRLDGEHWTLAARFEGRQSGLRAVASAVGDFLVLDETLEDRDSRAYWQRFMDDRAFADRHEVRLQMRSLPTEIVRLAEGALELIARAGLAPTRAEIEPGIGLATISWRDETEASAAIIDGVRAAGGDSNVIVLTAPDSLKTAIDVWGRSPESIDLMRRLKQEFDPHRVLNPGRFAGRI